jgi:hypothetical protein
MVQFTYVPLTLCRRQITWQNFLNFSLQQGENLLALQGTLPVMGEAEYAVAV